jgi:hypothetical protein
MLRIAWLLILLRVVRLAHYCLVEVGEMEVGAEGEKRLDERPCPLLMAGRDLVWFRDVDENGEIGRSPVVVVGVYRRGIDYSLAVGVYGHHIPP